MSKSALDILGLGAWKARDAVAATIACAVVLMVARMVPNGLLSPSAAFAGVCGGVAVTHMRLNGWRFTSGPMWRRLSLVGVWVVATSVGGAAMVLIGTR